VQLTISNGFTQIRYLRREQIDVHAWNKCIDHSANGLIYGYSYYLDHLSDHWDALVFSDYDAIMPLPWRKKAGIYYLYQPFNMAQLGVFGKEINKELVKAFLNEVPKHFRYWDFPLNQQNRFDIPGYPFYDRINYTTPLNQPHENLYHRYSENIKRNIKKCREAGCRITTGTNIDPIIELNKLHNKEASVKDYENFKKLFEYLKKKGLANSYGVLSNNDQLLSSAVFFYSHNRAYYILVGNHPDGRNVGASHALIDQFIKDQAGKNLILDFEGSDIEGLAKFYSGFGAAEEKYPAIRLNRLPFYLKWLKK
jgi:hypothetical protein